MQELLKFLKSSTGPAANPYMVKSALDALKLQIRRRLWEWDFEDRIRFKGGQEMKTVAKNFKLLVCLLLGGFPQPAVTPASLDTFPLFCTASLNSAGGVRP